MEAYLLGVDDYSPCCPKKFSLFLTTRSLSVHPKLNLVRAFLDTKIAMPQAS